MINYFFYFLILIILMIGTYTDLNYGIIPNKLVGPFIIIGFIYKLFFSFSIDLLITIFIACFISLFLFFMKIWAGGDCKLYLAMILLMPDCFVESSFYGISYIIWIPILAFLIGYFYVIGDSFFQKIKQHKKSNDLKVKVKNDFIRYLKYYIVIIFLSYCMNVFINYLNLQINMWLYMIIIFGMVYFLIKTSVLESKYVIGIIAFIDVFLGIIQIETLFNKRQLLIWLAVILTSLMKHFNNEYNYEEITVEQLKPGMILSTSSSYIFFNDTLSKYKKISDETLRSRLNEEDIKKINDLKNKRDYIHKITIMKKIPFALFISLSTFMIILGGMFI